MKKDKKHLDKVYCETCEQCKYYNPFSLQYLKGHGRATFYMICITKEFKMTKRVEYTPLVDEKYCIDYKFTKFNWKSKLFNFIKKIT